MMICLDPKYTCYTIERRITIPVSWQLLPLLISPINNLFLFITKFSTQASLYFGHKYKLSPFLSSLHSELREVLHLSKSRPLVYSNYLENFTFWIFYKCQIAYFVMQNMHGIIWKVKFWVEIVSYTETLYVQFEFAGPKNLSQVK